MNELALRQVQDLLQRCEDELESGADGATLRSRFGAALIPDGRLDRPFGAPWSARRLFSERVMLVKRQSGTGQPGCFFRSANWQRTWGTRSKPYASRDWRQARNGLLPQPGGTPPPQRE